MPENVTCNLCGSADAEPKANLTDFIDLQAPTQVVRCRKCGLHYLSPRPTPEELIELYIKEPYYSKENADRGATRLAFYGARMGRLEQLAPDKGELLGIGCLEGGYALEVAQARGWNVTGIESSEILATYARENLKIPVRTVHGWDLSGLDENMFDAVYTHSFEHFGDPSEVLAQMRRVLKPGGMLMVEVPYQFYALKDLVRRALIRLLGERRRLMFFGPPPPSFIFHLYYYDPKTLRELLRKQGFDIREFRTYLPRHPVFARNPKWRWVQESLYAIGGLFGRGPSLEVIARPSAES